MTTRPFLAHVLAALAATSALAAAPTAPAEAGTAAAPSAPSAPSTVTPPEVTEFSKTMSGAYDAAKKLSAETKYQEAASSLTSLIEQWQPKLPADQAASLTKWPEKAAEGYAQRAAWSAAASKDKKAARALLVDLLAPKSTALEVADPSDPRIAKLLASLRSLDPKAKAFFSPRKVHVVVTGNDLRPAVTQALVQAVVTPLRALGFEASSTEGAETLTLATSRGPDVDASNMFGTGVNMVSCEIKTDATWQTKAGVLVRVDLSKRDVGFPDMPDHCPMACARSVSKLVAPRLVQAWDAQ